MSNADKRGAAPAKSRCPWGTSDPLSVSYHADEWRVPLHDARRLMTQDRGRRE